MSSDFAIQYNSYLSSNMNKTQVFRKTGERKSPMTLSLSLQKHSNHQHFDLTLQQRSMTLKGLKLLTDSCKGRQLTQTRGDPSPPHLNPPPAAQNRWSLFFGSSSIFHVARLLSSSPAAVSHVDPQRCGQPP